MKTKNKQDSPTHPYRQYVRYKQNKIRSLTKFVQLRIKYTRGYTISNPFRTCPFYVLHRYIYIYTNYKVLGEAETDDCGYLFRFAAKDIVL